MYYWYSILIPGSFSAMVCLEKEKVQYDNDAVWVSKTLAVRLGLSVKMLKCLSKDFSHFTIRVGAALLLYSITNKNWKRFIVWIDEHMNTNGVSICNTLTCFIYCGEVSMYSKHTCFIGSSFFFVCTPSLVAALHAFWPERRGSCR